MIVTAQRFFTPMQLQNKNKSQNVSRSNNVSFKGNDGMSFPTMAVFVALLGTVSTIFTKSNMQNHENKVEAQIATKTSFEENAVINAKGALLGRRKPKYMRRVLDSLNEKDSLEIKRITRPDSEFNIAELLKLRKDSLADTARKIR